ncbi:MAG: ferritin family protein [Planctomycetes bacterium]|nr:ferritin family protein [Planctomycetota bacterium]MCH8121239.1 ferritin family protein [Planctomycetota bacterium]
MIEPDDCYEILQLAIAKEIEAYNFYLALADRVKDRQIRKAFKDLAEEELEHKAKLELEVMKTGKTVAVEQKPLRPDRNYILSDDELPLDMDYKDMLLLGIEKEEASFRTYVNLSASVLDEGSREVLLAIAEEEVKHKLRFETEYDLLLKKSGGRLLDKDG